MTYTKRNFVDYNKFLNTIIANSYSKKEVLLKYGIENKMAGGWYRSLRNYISKYNIDTSHFLKSSNARNTKKLTNEEIFCINGKGRPKPRFLKLVENKCAICGLDSWQGKKISFHMDHINGISYDHRLENLRLLCPNCHSQTDTYCMRKTISEKILYPCISCGRKSTNKKYCNRKCYIENTIKFKTQRNLEWPSNEELSELLMHNSMEEIGRKYNVTGAAVKKWKKFYKFNKVP